MRRRAFLALCILLFAAPSILQAQDGEVVVYLVRHAERAEDGTNDPPISQAGQERAVLLATLLADAGIDRIHSTDYKRTRQTGQPLSDQTGLAFESYDPRDLAGFAEELRSSPGRHLVLGHSNTTPNLVEALGGDSHGPIEEFEYDRLYVVVISGDEVSTVLIRFGAIYTP